MKHEGSKTYTRISYPERKTSKIHNFLRTMNKLYPFSLSEKIEKHSNHCERNFITLGRLQLKHLVDHQ